MPFGDIARGHYFLYSLIIKEADVMDLIERLLRCGIPERAAFSVYEDFKRRKSWEALIEYIETEEKERGLESI